MFWIITGSLAVYLVFYGWKIWAGFRRFRKEKVEVEELMPRPKATSLGDCIIRSLKVRDCQLCDLYVPKHDDKRFKVCCRNCVNFVQINLSSYSKKNAEDKSV